MPSVADYNAQQQLRAKCVRWLQNEGSGTAAYVFGTEKNNPLSSWSPANIERLLLGKDGPRERTGVYANEPALRAMAAISWKNLVVVNSCSGSNLEHPKYHGQPPDKVVVYLPGHSKVSLVAKLKSWACDIVPALLDPLRAKQYIVIIHNGDLPGSITGHFEATKTALV